MILFNRGFTDVIRAIGEEQPSPFCKCVHAPIIMHAHTHLLGHSVDLNVLETFVRGLHGEIEELQPKGGDGLMGEREGTFG